MKLSTTTIVKIALLAAVAVPLMLFDFPIPIFVSFLKLDFSDIPAIVAALAIGPLAGVMTEFIKNLVHLFIKFDTSGVGELANFLVGGAYVLPLGFIYHFGKKQAGVIKYRRVIAAAVVSSLLMTAVACVLNYYILVPFYAAAFGLPIDNFVKMGNALNSAIVDLKTLVLLSIAPFNMIKAIIISIAGYLLFRALGRFFIEK